ncbi:MAG: UDP-N-acetylmuramate dehydrogenase [Prevotella sp.]|jgi:UDP-N-acetylmuramate dehydrogenase
MKSINNASLLKRNTFGIDQKCDLLIEYDSTSDAQQTIQHLDISKPLLILGGGSNLLLTQDFHGTVVTPTKRFEISVTKDELHTDNVLLRCWAGSEFDKVVDYAVSHHYYGLENLSLIPGECGASAVQNIGAYGVEIKDVIEKIEAVRLNDGKEVVILPSDCRYAYRQSRFKHEWKNQFLITYVTYRLSKTFLPHLDYGNIRKTLEAKGIDEKTLTAEQLRHTIIDIRRKKLPDPAETGNAGSFFMNPIVSKDVFEHLHTQYPDMPHYMVSSSDGETLYKIPAGWMIDQCGWKGKSLGPAGVHEHQALVLVNRGGAKGNDIVRLMKAIQKDVRSKFGLEIQPEVNVI